MRILLVASTPLVAEQWRVPLEDARFVVELATDALETFDFVDTYGFDALVLARPIVGETAEGLTKGLRAHGIIAPILVMEQAGVRGDAIGVLDAGADDYAEWLSIGEMLARLRALIRRSNGRPASLMSEGPLTLDLNHKTLQIGGADVHLTGKEYEMLELLFLRKGACVTKEAFLSHLYQERDEPEIKIIDVFVCKLRRKLREYGADGTVQTLWGRGYTLKAPDAIGAPAE